MTILCDSIQKALRKGTSKSTPARLRCISTSSVDLTLSDEFKQWSTLPGHGLAVSVDPSALDYDFTELAEKHLKTIAADSDGSILIKPGEFVLARTLTH